MRHLGIYPVSGPEGDYLVWFLNDSFSPAKPVNHTSLGLCCYVQNHHGFMMWSFHKKSGWDICVVFSICKLWSSIWLMVHFPLRKKGPCFIDSAIILWGKTFTRILFKMYSSRVLKLNLYTGKKVKNVY